nr:PepSY-associated TM helix domain-containing protein [Zhihengliuella flava]
MHFYAGLFIGPFILIAALTGATYAVMPTVEKALYTTELSAPAYQEAGTVQPLSQQIGVADEVMAGREGYALAAVRPAPELGTTTRIMYSHPDLEASESHAVFVDPVSLEVRGQETVYGTSGALPARTAISQFHRHLGLGEPGRLYSELAASWLWIVALGGLALWILGRASRRKKRASRPRGHRASRLHASLGVWALLGALFLSATGLTWSAHAGANVTDLRAALGWTTPSVSTGLPAAEAADPSSGGSVDSGGEALTTADTFDAVWAAGRDVNIDTDLVEIKPAAEAGSAWTVTEIQRHYPTKVDSVAVDPRTLEVVDQVDFADYSVPAKLARWGVDLHMGTLFGLANEVVLAGLALSFVALVILGYALWIKRGASGPGRAPRAGALTRAPWWGLVLVLGAAAGIGVFLPLFGLSLAAFVVVDGVLAWAPWRRDRRPTPSAELT